MNDGTFDIERTEDEQLAEMIAADEAEKNDEKPNENIVTLKVAAGDDHKTFSMDLFRIPYEVRLHLLTNATKGYFTNRLSTAYSKAKKDNESWVTYDAAMANDPMQSYVSKPEEDRVEVDADKIIASAINALYTGELGRRKASGERKPKEAKDPFVAHITRQVVAEVYKDEHEKNPDYKYFAATAKVGSDGLAYLRKRIDERVAAGQSRADLEKVLDVKYIKPARTALGLDVPKTIQGLGDIF
jgi:hypothetical protein